MVLGGHQVGDRGYFHEPTIFTGVRNDMRIAQEEIFGPVMGILPFSTEEDAYRIANDVSYGLAAGVWTNDLNRAQRASRALKAGTVWINTYQMVYPSVPVRRRQDVGPWPHARRHVGRGDDHGQERVDGGPLMTALCRTVAAGPPRRRRRHLPVRVDDRHEGHEGIAGGARRRPLGAVRKRRADDRRRHRRRVDRRCHRGHARGNTICSACTTPTSTATRRRR